MTEETLWVNAYDGSVSQWDTYGDPPYLNVQNGVDYVEDNDRNQNCGYFTFQTTSVSGTINTVKLYMYAWGGATNDFEAEINDTGTGLGPPTSPGWVNIDVTTILDTWEKINAATLLLDRRSTTNIAGCDAAYLLIDYTESIGPTPNAFNKLAYTAGAPVPGAWNKVAYVEEPPTTDAWNKLKYGD